MRVPYALAVFDDEEINAVTETLRQHKEAMGEKTKAFEAKVAALFGKKHGIMVNSGSSANLTAIEVLNMKPGTEVVTPILTFATTIAPLIQKRLVPVFVDVQPGTYLLDVKQAEDAISDKTQCLMVPSLLGNVPDYPRLQQTAKNKQITLIEDSCDTLGAKINGKPTGSYTDISTTSFYGSHIITGAGGGGMICVNDDSEKRKCMLFRGWGRSSAIDESESVEKRFGTVLDGIPYDSKFIFGEVGYNFHPLEISAAFGLVQLTKLDNFIKTRQKNFAELKSFFSKYKEYFILPEQASNVETGWLAFPLTIKDGAPFERLELVKELERQNIQTRPVFTGNILRQPGFKDMPRREFCNDYPNTDMVMRQGFLVGCNNGLTSEHLEYMESVFSGFLDKLA